jgi:hypothetical protein
MATIPPELFPLLDTFCSGEEISNLLRQYQGVEGIRITASTKETLINVNLRNAIDAKIVPIEKVYDLIREAEENGSQYIFYYRPVGIPDPPSLDAVGKRLWGQNWQAKMKFPRVELAEGKFVFSDLRAFLPEKKPLDWVLKIYGHEYTDRATDIVKHISETRYTREFVREERRIVSIVRWNNPGLLEVRVPRLTDSHKQLKSWLGLVWQMIAPAINPNLFVKWDLRKTRGRMITEQKKHQKMYRCNQSRVRDGYQNVASFECNAPQGDLFASEGVVESVKRLIGADEGECTQLRATWLAKEGDIIPSRDVTTLIGHVTDPNEVLFTGQCTSRDVDYVTDQLRFFGK